MEKVVSPMMKILMEEDSEMLEDVVVIGYGSVKKSDATGSVTAIKPDDLIKAYVLPLKMLWWVKYRV